MQICHPFLDRDKHFKDNWVAFEIILGKSEELDRLWFNSSNATFPPIISIILKLSLNSFGFNLKNWINWINCKATRKRCCTSHVWKEWKKVEFLWVTLSASPRNRPKQSLFWRKWIDIRHSAAHCGSSEYYVLRSWSLELTSKLESKWRQHLTKRSTCSNKKWDKIGTILFQQSQ